MIHLLLAILMTAVIDTCDTQMCYGPIDCWTEQAYLFGPYPGWVQVDPALTDSCCVVTTFDVPDAPCKMYFIEDGRIVVVLDWDYNHDGVIDLSDLAVFGLQDRGDDWLSRFAKFGGVYLEPAVMEVE